MGEVSPSQGHVQFITDQEALDLFKELIGDESFECLTASHEETQLVSMARRAVDKSLATKRGSKGSLEVLGLLPLSPGGPCPSTSPTGGAVRADRRSGSGRRTVSDFSDGLQIDKVYQIKTWWDTVREWTAGRDAQLPDLSG